MINYNKQRFIAKNFFLCFLIFLMILNSYSTSINFSLAPKSFTKDHKLNDNNKSNDGNVKEVIICPAGFPINEIFNDDSRMEEVRQILNNPKIKRIIFPLSGKEFIEYKNSLITIQNQPKNFSIKDFVGKHFSSEKDKFLKSVLEILIENNRYNDVEILGLDFNENKYQDELNKQINNAMKKKWAHRILLFLIPNIIYGFICYYNQLSFFTIFGYVINFGVFVLILFFTRNYFDNVITNFKQRLISSFEEYIKDFKPDLIFYPPLFFQLTGMSPYVKRLSIETLIIEQLKSDNNKENINNLIIKSA